MKFSAGRCHLPRQRPLLLFGGYWKANVRRDLKEGKGHYSQMICGGYWDFVGSNNHANGRLPKLSFSIWKGLRCCHGHLMTWMEPWRQTQMNSRTPWRAIPVCFLYFSEHLRLTFNRPCVIGPIDPSDGSKPPAPRRGNPKEGWIRRLVRKAKEKFKVVP